MCSRDQRETPGGGLILECGWNSYLQKSNSRLSKFKECKKAAALTGESDQEAKQSCSAQECSECGEGSRSCVRPQKVSCSKD